MLFIIDSLERA